MIKHLNALAATRNTLLPEDQVAAGPRIDVSDELGYPEDEHGSRPSTSQTVPSSAPAPAASEESQNQSQPTTQKPSQTPTQTQKQTQPGETRRQRRRLDDLGERDGAQQRSPSTASSRSPMRRNAEEESIAETEESGEDEIAVAVGQLSLNEDEQVRFHGKASGLHMLGVKERTDGRNEGGLWRFPKARVWPPLPPAVRNSQRRETEEFVPRLPDLATQELLLELYFTYVHPALPIVHKRTLMEDFRNG